MARKKTDGNGGRLWNKAKWQGFVNVKLGQEEKKAIKSNLVTEGDGFEFLMNAATEGYKCSISYSIPEDVYTVSLTGSYQEKPNAGITMSIRHRDFLVAVTAVKWVMELDGVSTEWSDRYTLLGDDNW